MTTYAMDPGAVTVVTLNELRIGSTVTVTARTGQPLSFSKEQFGWREAR